MEVDTPARPSPRIKEPSPSINELLELWAESGANPRTFIKKLTEESLEHVEQRPNRDY